MVRITITISICLISVIANAQGIDFSLVGQKQYKLFQLQKTDQQATIKPLPAPRDAVAAAVADLAKIPEGDRIFYRYVWVPDGDKFKIAAVDFTVNHTVSKASVLVTGVVVPGNLIRYDLRALAPLDSQLSNLIRLWEKFAIEPYFHIVKKTNDILPVDAVQIDSLATDPPGSSRFTKNGAIFFKKVNGQLFTFKNNIWSEVNFSHLNTNVTQVSAYGGHVNLNNAVLLQGLSQSSAAVVRCDYFIIKLLTTLNGGLYYEAVGIQRHPKGRSAQEQFFLDFAGVTEAQIENLRSDQRLAMFQSQVTGKPRRVDMFQGAAVRPGVGSGLVTITHDPFDEDIDPSFDPIRNLLELKDRAREVIVEDKRGVHIFALFDANGALQDFVPDNVADDRTIPSPYTTKLEPGIGCIRCHGPHDGLQPLRNDVKAQINGSINVYNDFSNAKSRSDNLDRLLGLYSGDFDKPIRRARDDYADAVFVLTKGMTIPDTSSAISSIFSSYKYTMVDAHRACAELGYDVDRANSVLFLNTLLSRLPPDELGISPEDPILDALKSGLSVTRIQWEHVYADAAFRAWQSTIQSK